MKEMSKYSQVMLWLSMYVGLFVALVSPGLPPEIRLGLQIIAGQIICFGCFLHLLQQARRRAYVSMVEPGWKIWCVEMLKPIGFMLVVIAGIATVSVGLYVLNLTIHRHFTHIKQWTLYFNSGMTILAGAFIALAGVIMVREEIQSLRRERYHRRRRC
ncbi:MAG: hypothetical protein WC027_01545 [Candidatus Paceibacterota bacterium]